jgi:hypothetical protein
MIGDYHPPLDMVVETRSGKRYLAYTDPEFGLMFVRECYAWHLTIRAVRVWYNINKNDIPWGKRVPYSRDGFLTCYKPETQQEQ